MKNNVIYAVVAICVMMMTSCEKVIYLGKDDIKIMTVVNAILYADSTAVVNVTRSKSIVDYSPENYHGEDAEVSLYVNGDFVEKLTFLDGRFKGNHVLRQGDEVRIEVERPDAQTAVAQTYIPMAAEIVGMRMDSVETSLFSDFYVPGSFEYDSVQDVWVLSWCHDIHADHIVDATMHFSITVQDGTQGGDYYRLCDLAPTHNYSGQLSSTDTIIASYTNSNAWGFEESFNNKYMVYDDRLINGELYTVHVDALYAYSGYKDGFINLLNQNPLSVSLCTISRDYYYYAVSLNKYENQGFNLFAEPIQVYSNVENGVGVVCGACARKVTLDMLGN